MEGITEKILNFIVRVNDTIFKVAPSIINWLSAELNSTQQLVFGVQYRFELIIGAGLVVILSAIIVKWIKDFIV